MCSVEPGEATGTLPARGALSTPPILPCLWAKLLWHPALPKDSSKEPEISTSRALGSLSPGTKAANGTHGCCLLLVPCPPLASGMGTKCRGAGSCQGRRGRGHLWGRMKAEAGADLSPLTCSAL